MAKRWARACVAVVIAGGLSAAAGITPADAVVAGRSPQTAQWQISYSSSTLMTSFDGALALSPTNVWAVGNEEPPPGVRSPVVERWNGSAWTAVPLPRAFSSAFVWAVAGSSAWNIWLFGSYSSGGQSKDFALRWNGSSWSLIRSWPESSGSISTSAVISKTDIWVFGSIGAWHFNGTKWSQSRLPYRLFDVSVINSNDMWAVGSDTVSGAPVLARRHDGSWTTMKLPAITSGPPGPALDSVLANSDSDLWLVGGTVTGGSVRSLVLHWFDGQWVTVAQPTGGGYLGSVVPDGAGGLWSGYAGPYDASIALHFTSGEWQSVPFPTEPSTNTSAPVLVRIPRTGTVFAAGMSFWGNEPQTEALMLRY